MSERILPQAQIEANNHFELEVQTPIEIPRDSRGRIRWQLLETDPTQLARVIETEARSAMEQGVPLKHNALSANGLSYLSRAIVAYYPGRYPGLRQALDLPTGNKPKNYWNDSTIIEQEARQFVERNGNLTQKTLEKAGNSGIANAAYTYYPGGLQALKDNLGIVSSQKPNGYWTHDRIVNEAVEFYMEHGQLSRASLHQASKDDLEAAIKKHAGGLAALRKELGIVTQRKPNGYWTSENIFAQAVDFYTEHGNIVPDTLTAHKRYDLLYAAVNRYPGGIRQLQKDLGIKPKSKDVGFWIEDTIREEALAFFNQYGGLTHTLLVRSGRFDLNHAIYHKYPGSIRQLQTDLGVESGKRPNGYWTPENIEREAQEFFDAHGILNFGILNRQKSSSLANAISIHYPGGLIALREKLGIDGKQQGVINSDEANIQLERLLEVQI
ncbi:MAG: hypothetical protein AAB414_02030 [Patescibacteria group bacterium]